jgi:hypothetical protein
MKKYRSQNDPTPAMVGDRRLCELLRAATATSCALWRAEKDPELRRRIAVATTLLAHTAIDAMLEDAARGAPADPESTRPGTVLMRASRATAARGRALPGGLADLCQARRALGRNRSRADLGRIADWLDGDGAEEALRAVEELHEALQVAAPE